MATKIIEVKRDGGDVTLKLSVTGLVGWVYKYVFRDGEHAGASARGTSEQVHVLGSPAALHLRSHVWRIITGRLSDQEEQVTVVLVWEQEVDGANRELHRDASSATLKAGNEVELFKGSVAFKEVSAL